MTGNRRSILWRLVGAIGIGLLTGAMNTLVFTGTAHASPGPSVIEQLRRAVATPLPGGIAISARAADDNVDCWEHATIRSGGNGLYVKADVGLTVDKGLLRAVTPGSAIGAWEKFYICRNRLNWRTVLMSEYNERFVAAELDERDYPDVRRGLLRARTKGEALGEWEAFTSIAPPASNGPGGAGNSSWIFSPSAGKYVSAQLDYADTSLRARLGSVGPWEWFTWSGTYDPA